jgi:hypothetical protein
LVRGRNYPGPFVLRSGMKLGRRFTNLQTQLKHLINSGVEADTVTRILELAFLSQLHDDPLIIDFAPSDITCWNIVKLDGRRAFDLI